MTSQSQPPVGWPRISPYLLYEDVESAIRWLEEALGFRLRHSIAGSDGRVVHADLVLDGGVVLIGCPGPSYRNPQHLGVCTQSQYIYVDDVDASFARATAAGGLALESPADQPYGDRRCGVADREGHRWYLASRLANR